MLSRNKNKITLYLQSYLNPEYFYLQFQSKYSNIKYIHTYKELYISMHLLLNI